MIGLTAETGLLGVSLMDRIGTWVDAKPHRFQLMLLANTAAFVCASCLRWSVSDTALTQRRAGRMPWVLVARCPLSGRIAAFLAIPASATTRHQEPFRIQRIRCSVL